MAILPHKVNHFLEAVLEDGGLHALPHDNGRQPTTRELRIDAERARKTYRVAASFAVGPALVEGDP